MVSFSEYTSYQFELKPAFELPKCAYQVLRHIAWAYNTTLNHEAKLTKKNGVGSRKIAAQNSNWGTGINSSIFNPCSPF
jgi:hypothetical protein